MRRVIMAAVFAVLACGAAVSAQTAFETALEKARLALDTGRPEEAAQLYEKAVAIDPAGAADVAAERAWAYVKLGNEALRAGDNAAADEYFTLAVAIEGAFKDAVAPQWAFAKLNIVNETMNTAFTNDEEADWEALVREVRRALEMSPSDRQAFYTLGALQEILHKEQEAREYYLRALANSRKGPDRTLKALRETARKAVSGLRHTFDLRPVFPPWHETDGDELRTYKTGPFVIHHYNENVAKRLAAVLTHHLQTPLLDGVLEAGGPFPEVCNVYIFADEGEFRDSGGNEVWSGGQAKLFAHNGKLVATQVQLYQTARELTESAAPHELTHVRLLAAWPHIETLPLWLQEGVASSAESAYAKELHARRLAEAAGELMPFERVMDAETYPEGEAHSLFYSQSLAAVESLVEREGAERFWQFVKAIETVGRRRALRNVYGVTPGDVDNLILEWSAARR